MPETDYALFDIGTPSNGGFSKLLKSATNGCLIHILVDDIEKKLNKSKKPECTDLPFDSNTPSWRECRFRGLNDKS
jgi:hypothetical protein